MNIDWKKETARDLRALGGIPFYLIITLRAVIGEFRLFLYWMVIALIVSFILLSLIKNSDSHLARAFVLAAFTSLYYKKIVFTVFVFLFFILMIVSSDYLKIKRIAMIKGFIIGVISSVSSYYLAPFVPF